MNRTTVKTLSLLALAAFPFIAGCAGPSERIHQYIQSGDEAQTSAYVESVIEKISVDYAAAWEVKICEEIWNAGLALATKPKLEAKLKEVKERICKNVIKAEKQQIFQRLQEEIFPAEQRLSESERSRGRALLDAFGEEHMPLLAEQCKKARTRYLETEANLKELVAALEAEDPNFSPDDTNPRHISHRRASNSQKENPVYSAAKARCLELAANYWQLRYTLTDYYSQFKIGVITSDELAAKDEELAALFAEAEKINLTESESK